MPADLGTFDNSVPFVGPPWFEASANWVKRHARGLLFAGVVFQLMVLVSMIAIHSAPLVFGKRILLHVVPVDPRDLFRGDYVVLNYDFSQLPVAGIDGLPEPPRWRRHSWSDEAWLADRPVYVSLEPDADGVHYHWKGISLERPASGLFIKGKYSHGGWPPLSFGIEAYYVQEGDGKVLEQARNAGQLSAEVAITSWGQAALCGLK